MAVTNTRNTSEFNEWWIAGGYKQWAEGVENNTLDAIEAVYLAGAESSRSPGCYLPITEIARCLGALVQDLCNKGILMEAGGVTFKDTGELLTVGEMLDRLNTALEGK